MAAAPTPPFIQAKHYSAGGNTPVDRIVIHGTVSPCERGGAENIARYFQNPSYPSSCHYVVDPGEVRQCVNDWDTAYHAPPNARSIGVELCDPQEGPDSRWDDANHVAMLERAARLVRQLCEAYNVPMRWLSPADLRAGLRGITDHENVGIAWRQTTHVDPGWSVFRSDEFMARVHDDAAPTPNLGGDDVSYEDAKNAIVDVLWRERHPSRVPGSDVKISLADGVLNTDMQAYATRQIVAGYQAAFDRLADALAGIDTVDADQLKAAVREAMADVVKVEVSVDNADA